MLALSVFCIALVFSVFGMGGGLFYMPLFLAYSGNFRESSALSFLCIAITAFSAMCAYHKQRLIEWKLVGYLGVPLAAAIFVSGFMLKATSAGFLKAILGIALSLGGACMFFSSQTNSLYVALSGVLKKYFPHRQFRVSPVSLAPVSFVIGLLSGMSGVAGGVFEIPLMVSALGVSAHTAAACSSVIVLIAAAAGFAGRFMSNSVHIHFDSYLFFVILCAFLGAQIGPQISLKIKKDAFKKCCAITVVVIGMYYLCKGCGQQ